MEVRPGYKMTGVGVIPEDWEVAQVAKKGDVVTGKALAIKGPGALRPYLRTKNVFDGKIDIDDVLSMPMTDAQFEQFRVLEGDVLLNEGQSLELVGRCAIYKGDYPAPCAIQNALLRFRAKPGVSGVFASYVFRFCQQSGVFARVALQTTSIAHLGGTRFQRLSLAWPKTEKEQLDIATALSDMDLLLGALERLIAKKRDLRLAATQQLLTGQTRIPGFSGDWPLKSLRSVIADLEAGISVNSEDGEMDTGDSYPAVLKTSSVAAGNFFPEECKMVASRDIARVRLSPRAETVLISRMNTIELVGECGYVPRDFPNLFVPDRLWMTRFKSHAGISAKWLAYVLSSPSTRTLLRNIATGTSGSMKNIAKGKFLALEFPTPTQKEQIAIATVFTDMDTEIAALEHRLAKTRALKQGVMQELLTGRIRLVLTEGSRA